MSNPSPRARAATTFPGGISTVALSIALALGTAPQLSHAQQAPVAINLGAQPLGDALVQLANAYGLELAYAPDIVHGRSAPAVSGSLTADQALDRLLAGSSIAYRRTGRNVALWQALQGSSAQPGTLPQVVVTAPANASEITEGTGAYTTGSTNAATGLSLSLRETPQSVTVVTRQRLDDQNLNSLQDALAQTPGITLQGEGTPVGGRTSLYARGYAVNSYQIDGLTVSSAGWSGGTWGGGEGSVSIDTALYDSVTVLRGATGLLTGAGNPGATVSLARKRPTDTFQASLAQSLGRWQQRRTVGDVGGPLNEAGTLRGRLVGAYEAGNGWQDRYGYDKQVAYGVLEAELSRDTMLSAALEHGREEAQGTGGGVSGFGTAYADGSLTAFGRSANPVADWSRYKTRRTSAAVTLDHRLSDDWKAQLQFTHNQFDSRFKWGSASGTINLDESANFMVRNFHLQNNVNAAQAKLDGKFDLWGRQHDLVVGYSGQSSKEGFPNAYTGRTYGQVQTDAWTGAYPEPDWSSHLVPAGVYATRQSGLWLATRIRPTDRLSVITGGRYSQWRHQVTSPAGVMTDNREENGAFTPYAGLVYDFSPHLSAYASYTTIFNPQSYRDVEGNVLDPEEGRNIELGIKGEWFAGQLNASAAVFQVRKDNLAIADGTNQTPQGGQAYVAADDTQGRGWELEIAGEPLAGWHLHAGLTRMLTRNSSGLHIRTSQPEHVFKLFSSWTPRSHSQLSLGGGVTWQSEAIADGSSDLLRAAYTQKAYAVANLMARYRFTDQLSLNVNLNNVFDKAYRTSLSAHTYGAPRNVNATLKYQF